MICDFCGHDNEPGASLCARCGVEFGHGPKGTQYQQPQIYQQPEGRPIAEEFEDKQYRAAGIFKSVAPTRKILIIVIPAVVIIVALIVVASMLGGSGGSAQKNHIEFFSDSGESIISGNNNEKFAIKGTAASTQISLDGSKAVVLIDFNSRNGGALWFVTTSGAVLIAEDVFAYRLADSGNGVAYFTEYDDKIDEAALYLYDTSGRKATLITDKAYFNGNSTMPGVAISPNGKSVGYILDYDERNYEFTGYIKIDGKNPEKVGDEMFAVAISDGGKYLYYRKVDVKTGEASLHVRSGRNEFRLVPDASNVQMMLNKDYSEVLLSVYDGDRRTFISRRGGERERISGAAILSLVMSRGAQTRTCDNEFSNVIIDIIVYGKSSMSDFVAVTDEGLAYYNNRLEANKIAGSSNYAYSAEISNDGKTLYFINNSNRLSSIDPTVPGAERKEIEKSVLSFAASGNGRSVYYVNDVDELYYVSGSGTQTLIAEEVYSGSLTMSYSSNRVFFLMDYRSNRGGELYCSNNGGRRAKVSGADEVMALWSTPANIFYISRDNELFRSNGNEKFALFHDRISRWEVPY